MIPYQELKSAVIRNLQIDATDDDIQRFNIQGALNSALIRVLNFVPDWLLQNAIATIRVPLAKFEQKYQMPDDFIRPVEVWVNFDNPITDSEPGRKVIIYRKGDSDSFHVNPAAMADKYFPVADFGMEKGMILYPTPSKTVIGGLRIRYVYKQSDMGDNQDCLLDLRLKNLLVFWATEIAASTEGYDLALSDKYGKMAEEELLGITGGAKK